MLTRPASTRPVARPVLLAVVLALLLAACVSSTPPPADVPPVVVPAVTTQPAVPPEPVTEEVQAAVEDYWEARDAAFAAGPEAGIAFIVANNHPLLPYTADQCREAWFDGEVPAGFVEHTALLEGSIESDPDWMMVQGPLAGRDLGGGLFSMVVAFSYEGQGLRVADRVATVHLQVVDGAARQFMLCEEVEVIVVVPPTSDAVAPSTTTGGGTTTTTPTTTVTTPPTTTAPPAPTTLPPITATAAPVPPGTGGNPTTPTTPPAPPQTGTRPPGTGIDFCDEGDPGAQPVAGDYYLCPDTDVTNIEGEDGGSSEPDPDASGG